MYDPGVELSSGGAAVRSSPNTQLKESEEE